MNFEKDYERMWRRANHWFRLNVIQRWKQLWCKHESAWHQKAVEYDSNPPHGRMRWAVMQREVCSKCGKVLGKSSVIRDKMSYNRVRAFMRQLQRQQKREFN